MKAINALCLSIVLAVAAAAQAPPETPQKTQEIDVPGSQQWRNTQGEDTSLALAYRVFSAAGATGTVARTSDDNDAGLYFRLAWKQVTD